MTYPTIHLNGTSPEELQEQLITVADHLMLALKALAEARPHGRDYYTSDYSPREGVWLTGNRSLTQATDEALDREARVRAVYDEIRAISANIEEQDLARRIARGR
jgi:hypothetical protein